MLELAGQGSKVLQTRSVEFAHKYNVPLRVLSTFEHGPGTLIANGDRNVEAARITGIACSRNEAEIRVSGISARPEAAFELLASLADNRIDVDMIVQHVDSNGRMNFAFTVTRQDYDQAREVLALRFRGTSVDIAGDNRVAKVGLVGSGVRQQADVAVRMFAALARAGIAVRQVATSELRISVVVDEIEMENAVRALHHEFGLSMAVAVAEA